MKKLKPLYLAMVKEKSKVCKGKASAASFNAKAKKYSDAKVANEREAAEKLVNKGKIKPVEARKRVNKVKKEAKTTVNKIKKKPCKTKAKKK